MLNDRLLHNQNNRKNVVLEVPLSCSTCDNFINESCPEDVHNSVVEEVPLVVKPLTWMEHHEIRNKSMAINPITNEFGFSIPEYINNCLKSMILEAPWGETNDMFLLQVGPELGAALERVIPSLNTPEVSSDVVEKLKKVQKHSLEVQKQD